jgi:hypothetical protein
LNKNVDVDVYENEDVDVCLSRYVHGREHEHEYGPARPSTDE